MAGKKPSRSSRVPTGRIERLARLGWMTGEFALGGAAEGLKRAVGASGDVDATAFLSPANAERLARHLSRMRGAAMKVGQMLSLLDDRMVPPEFAEALAILRDSADMMPKGQVGSVMAREFGADWQALFHDFDFEPIAAASIGQVHTAIALDGRELALKIQYPGVAESIESDVDNLATALMAARILPGNLDLDPIIEEAKRQLRQEADYDAEADFLQRYDEVLEADPRFVVPVPAMDLTTPRVLAMKRILGLPLEDLSGPEHSQQQRDETAARLLELMFRELFEFGLMQTDPNFSNYLLLPDGETLGLLDLGSARDVPAGLAAGYRQIFCALRAGDHEALRHACETMGYLRSDDPEAPAERFTELLELIYEPLAHHGLYEFGESDFVARAQSMGMELVFRHGFLRTPPAETIFVQRKLDGMLMLASRIRARVDVGEILDRVLEETGRG
jgi:predicted unusual protein kinase regulating ubiquinone biosynthesis (AarF/ABC1/UbiB family)